MSQTGEKQRLRLHVRLIRFIGLIVPRRFRARFRQEWVAELEYREELLARWDRLDWRNKLNCCGAAWGRCGTSCGCSNYDWRTK